MSTGWGLERTLSCDRCNLIILAIWIWSIWFLQCLQSFKSFDNLCCSSAQCSHFTVSGESCWIHAFLLHKHIFCSYYQCERQPEFASTTAWQSNVQKDTLSMGWLDGIDEIYKPRWEGFLPSSEPTPIYQLTPFPSLSMMRLQHRHLLCAEIISKLTSVIVLKVNKQAPVWKPKTHWAGSFSSPMYHEPA